MRALHVGRSGLGMRSARTSMHDSHGPGASGAPGAAGPRVGLPIGALIGIGLALWTACALPERLELPPLELPAVANILSDTVSGARRGTYLAYLVGARVSGGRLTYTDEFFQASVESVAHSLDVDFGPSAASGEVGPDGRVDFKERREAAYANSQVVVHELRLEGVLDLDGPVDGAPTVLGMSGQVTQTFRLVDGDVALVRAFDAGSRLGLYQCANSDAEPNDEPALAVDLGTLQETTRVEGCLSGVPAVSWDAGEGVYRVSGDTDVFRFTVGRPGSLLVTLTREQVPADYRISVAEAGQAGPPSRAAAGDGELALRLPAAADVVYVLTVAGLAGRVGPYVLELRPAAPAACGDGFAEGDEACDASDLKDTSCPEPRVPARAPTCRADCTVDFTGCTCVPACLPAAQCGSDGCVGRCGVCAPDFECRAGQCEPAADAGAVVISEVLVRPWAVSRELGQFVELTNVSNAERDLTGWILRTARGEPLSLSLPDRSLRLAPGAVAVVAPNGDATQNGGLPAETLWPVGALDIDAAGDTLTLVNASGTLVDEVAFRGADVLAPGRSWSLDPGATDATRNDDRDVWCLSTAPGRPGRDHGSPGAPNPPCP